MDNELKYQHVLPVRIEVQQGRVYKWCGCGDSQTQPLCDKPNCSAGVTYCADLSEDVVFCNCKQTKNPPWCDGSHAKVLLDLVANRNTLG